MNDHRPLGWETLHGPEAYVASLESLVELAPDGRHRIEHVIPCPGGLLTISTWLGTREGGAFEASRAIVAELDELGRIRRLDFYDLDQLDAARARFEELAPGQVNELRG